MSGLPETAPDGASGHHQEALEALTMLGFSRLAAEKALLRVASNQPDTSVEELIKQALKQL